MYFAAAGAWVYRDAALAVHGVRAYDSLVRQHPNPELVAAARAVPGL
jgi:hypothetical protein